MEMKTLVFCVISGYRREVDEMCSFPRYYARTLDFLTFEGETDRLSRNVGKKLPLYAA